MVLHGAVRDDEMMDQDNESYVTLTLEPSVLILPATAPLASVWWISLTSSGCFRSVYMCY